MPYQEIEQLIGPSVLMQGVDIELEEAIRMTQSRFPGRAFCIVDAWVWLDFSAPDLVVQELAAEGKKQVMLLLLNVVFDSVTQTDSGHWLRSSPLIDFSEGMFFQTQNQVYVLLGNGRRKSMPLSTLVRYF